MLNLAVRQRLSELLDAIVSNPRVSETYPFEVRQFFDVLKAAIPELDRQLVAT